MPRKPQIPSFRRVTAPLAKAAMPAAVARLQTFARVQSDQFKARLREQSFESFRQVPLSPDYAQRKEAQGLDGRTMIATKGYVSAIRPITDYTPGTPRATVHIGFDASDRARDADGNLTKLPLSALAEIHEKGSATANVPARPHWTPHLPHLADAARRVAPKVVAAVMEAARKLAKARGGLW